MEFVFLGTGNARGIPAFGCDCKMCCLARKNKEFERKCVSHLVRAGGRCFALDAGRFDLHRIIESETYFDGVVLSHFHPDHVYGLQMLSWGKGERIKVYCPPDKTGYADLLSDPGILDFCEVSEFKPFSIGEVKITPFPLCHGVVTFGYSVEHLGKKVAYLMDTCGLPRETELYLKEWCPDVAVIDCNQTSGNESKVHNTPEQAFGIHSSIGAKESWVSHLSCASSRWFHEELDMPINIHVAHDGVTLLL